MAAYSLHTHYKGIKTPVPAPQPWTIRLTNFNFCFCHSLKPLGTLCCISFTLKAGNQSWEWRHDWIPFHSIVHNAIVILSNIPKSPYYCFPKQINVNIQNVCSINGNNAAKTSHFQIITIMVLWCHKTNTVTYISLFGSCKNEQGWTFNYIFGTQTDRNVMENWNDRKL